MKSFLILIALVGALFAEQNDWTVLEESFKSAVGKDRYSSFKQYATTPLFLEAKTYFTDKSKMYDTEKQIGDPHTASGIKYKHVLIPHWPNIFNVLYDSAIKENNPISAYFALTVAGAYLGKLNKGEMLEKRKELAKALYDNKICQGYLDYGMIFEQGIATKVDYEKAMNIYKEGTPICNSLSNAWQSTVIEMNYLRVKKKIK